MCALFDLRDLTRAANKKAQPDSCERYMACAAQLPWQHPSRPQLSDPWLPMGPYQACGIRLAITVVGSHTQKWRDSPVSGLSRRPLFRGETQQLTDSRWYPWLTIPILVLVMQGQERSWNNYGIPKSVELQEFSSGSSLIVLFLQGSNRNLIGRIPISQNSNLYICRNW